MNTLWCPDSVPSFLSTFDLSIAPPLLFYSYIPVILLSLLVGIYVISRDNFSLVSRLLFVVAMSFTAWVLNIFIAWIDAYHTHVMLAWVVTPVIEVVIFSFAVYFVEVFIDEDRRDISAKMKSTLLLLGAPVAILTPTAYNISYFNAAYCEGVPGPMWLYMYLFEVLIMVWIGVICFRRYRETKDSARKKQITYILLGMNLFLLLFFLSNVVGQYTGIQEISFIGSFGMVAFLGFLAYLIVKYKAFNIKLIGAQVLVLALVVLVGSQFFYAKTVVSQVMTVATFVLVTAFGFFLIRSVEAEVRRKEELQEMATKLAVTNEELKRLDNSKSEFISIASHQLRTPLTAIKGFLSLILEGSYGKVNPQIEDVINKVYSANSHLVDLVENLLNISRIDSGRIQYQFAPADIADIIHELADSLTVIAKGRGLALLFTYPETPIEPFLMDAQKIREVVSNLIDNAVKYTKEGSISVVLERSGDIVRVTVTDTGVGIAPEDLRQLFQKFRRGTGAGKVNVSGTGLGLYVGKSFVDAHGGKISVESEGVGKGSRFIVELPFRTK